MPFWVWIAGGGGILLLLLLLLCCLCCCCPCCPCARKKKKRNDAVGGFDNPDMDDYYTDIHEQSYADIPNETIQGSGTNGHAGVHATDTSLTNGAATTSGANGHAGRNLPTGAVPIIGAAGSGGAPPVLYRKPKLYKKSAGRKAPAPDPETGIDTRFEMNDSNVKTGILRAVNRLRNRLSSIRWSGQNQDKPEDVYTEVGDGNVPSYGDANKANRAQKQKVEVPLQTHKLPRGFAPASHTVPVGLVKQSWGRAKHNKYLGK
jgi:hypothetical protein